MSEKLAKVREALENLLKDYEDYDPNETKVDLFVKPASEALTILSDLEAEQGWRGIETMPIGSNEKKNSHVITINKYGNIHRAYRIHDGTGQYHMHHPYYNEHGQENYPVGWINIPAPPTVKCEYAKLANERGMMHLAAECDCEECNDVLNAPPTKSDERK